MLLTFSGFGMRIAFVDEEDVNDEPEIVVREPGRQGGSMSGEAAIAWDRMSRRKVLLEKFAGVAVRVKALPFLKILAGPRSVPALLHAVTSVRSSCPAQPYAESHVRQDALRP